jgi:hypothetical protein
MDDQPKKFTKRPAGLWKIGALVGVVVALLHWSRTVMFPYLMGDLVPLHPDMFMAGAALDLVQQVITGIVLGGLLGVLARFVLRSPPENLELEPGRKDEK